MVSKACVANNYTVCISCADQILSEGVQLLRFFFCFFFFGGGGGVVVDEGCEDPNTTISGSS